MVGRLELGWRDVAAGPVETLGVPPGHLGRRVLRTIWSGPTLASLSRASRPSSWSSATLRSDTSACVPQRGDTYLLSTTGWSAGLARLFPAAVHAVTASDFLSVWSDFLGCNRRPTDRSPWGVLEQWESLVDQATEGNVLGSYDFTNDLSVRDLLAKALEDETLGRFEQMATMRERVEVADARFRAVLMPGVEIGGSQRPWWQRGVLARSSDEYAEDMARLYGIDVT